MLALFYSVLLHNQEGTTAEKGGFSKRLVGGFPERHVSASVRTLLVVEKYIRYRNTLTRGCDNSHDYGNLQVQTSRAILPSPRNA